MSTLHITRGLPAAGKTTWAKAWTAEAPGRARVNRDDLRAMIYGRARLEWAEEERVTAVQRDTARALLKAGTDVVCDDMNLRPKYVREWGRFARANGHDMDVHEFPVTVDESVARDAARGSKVGEPAIRGMARFLVKGALAPIPTDDEPAPVALYVPNDDHPDAWLVDIDGTLALNTGGRSPYDLERVGEDEPNHPVIDVVYGLASMGMQIVFCSGREDSCRDATEAWLDEHLGYNAPLFMRAADDKRRDSLVKRDLLEEIGKLYAVRGVLDDRDQVVEMWRAAGLTCLQVADGDF